MLPSVCSEVAPDLVSKDADQLRRFEEAASHAFFCARLLLYALATRAAGS
jgi:hypothetical protein